MDDDGDNEDVRIRVCSGSMYGEVKADGKCEDTVVVEVEDGSFVDA